MLEPPSNTVSQARDQAEPAAIDPVSGGGGGSGGVRDAGLRAVGYIRVSTKGQAVHGVSLEHQKAALLAEAGRRGWSVELVREEKSAETLRRRPGLERALQLLDGGGADVLLVSRMDRAFRSVGDFAATMARAERCGWLIRMLDPDVDMGTPYGRAMAGVAAVFAQLERELIAQRTREGIAVKQAQGTYRGGRLLPQSRPVAGAVVARIVELAGEGGGGGLSSREVARRLDLEAVPSPRGGGWQHSTVLKVLRRERAAAAGAAGE